jgi:serine/threonine protein kinase
MLNFNFNCIKCLYRADLWAFGCVIYQMLSGKSPFKAATDYLIFQKIKNLEYTIPNDFPPSAKDIVQRLLTSEPEKRFGSAATGGIDAIKEHPFFEGIDWDNIFTSNAPPLRERLEKEAKVNPIIPPSFDFGGQNDDDAEEDLWLNNTSKINNGRIVSSTASSGSALAGALAGALAQTATNETTPQTETSNAPNPFYNYNNKIPEPTSSASTPPTQLNDPLITKKVQHSRQSSSASQLQPQTQHQLAQPPLNSNRSSHISSELSSSRNSISPERLGNEGAGRTQPHLPW